MRRTTGGGDDMAPPRAQPAASVRPTSATDEGRTALLALLAELGIGGFIGGVAILHLLRPDLDPRTRTISEYAVGPGGAVMATAFLALGAGTLALAGALARGRAFARLWRTGQALLVAFGLGAALCAVFPTDLTTPGVAPTTTGRVHNAAAVIALGAGLGVLLAGAGRFREEEPWRALSWPTLAAALLAVAAVFTLGRMGGFGWGERAFVGIIVVWHAIFADRVRRRAAAR